MSIFLAKAFSLYFIIMGSALFFNSKTWPGMYDEFFKSKASLALAGAIALILGILLILTHNIWVIGWPLLITLASWATFIKGTSILFFPEQMIAFSRTITREFSLRIVGIYTTLLGLLFGYFGFLQNL